MFDTKLAEIFDDNFNDRSGHFFSPEISFLFRLAVPAQERPSLHNKRLVEIVRSGLLQCNFTCPHIFRLNAHLPALSNILTVNRVNSYLRRHYAEYQLAECC